MYLSIFYNITFCLKNNDRNLYDLNNFTPYSNNEIDQGCIGLNHCDNDMIQPKNSKLTLLELVFQTAGAINPSPPSPLGLIECTFFILQCSVKYLIINMTNLRFSTC